MTLSESKFKREGLIGQKAFQGNAAEDLPRGGCCWMLFNLGYSENWEQIAKLKHGNKMKCDQGENASKVVGMGVTVKEINAIRRIGAIKWLSW